MPIWPRVLVFIIFVVVGASFLATTAALAWEFKYKIWIDLASIDCHIFVFFPTLGIVALVAFYMPSVVFTDLYWSNIPQGRARFIAGFIIVVFLSNLLASCMLDNPRRGLWETAPKVLVADDGEPPGCAKSGRACERLPLLIAIRNLRQVSSDRIGLNGFIRDCSARPNDALLEQAQRSETRRFCFASMPLSSAPGLQTDEECCKAQARLIATVRSNYENPSTRSFTARVHATLLPFKVFFLLIVFTISILLALHHREVEESYKFVMPQMEIGLFVGAMCMLFFPLMSQAFLLSSEVLTGSTGHGMFALLMPIISFLSMTWVLLVGLFFYRRSDNGVVMISRFMGILVSNIGIIKYNLLISIFLWSLGAGASVIGLISLILGSVCSIIFTIQAMNDYDNTKINLS